MARVALFALIIAALVLAPSLLQEDRVDPAPQRTADRAAIASLALGDMLKERSAWPTRCDDGEAPLSEEKILDKTDEFIAQAMPVLEASGDPEHQMVAALLVWRKQPERAAMALNEAARLDPSHPIVASQHLELCDRAGGYCGEPRVTLENRLIATDKANGMAWLQVTRSRLSRSDEAGALEALRAAATSATFEDFFAEHVLIFDRAITATTGASPGESIENAFGFAAAMLSSAYLVSRDCKERSTSSAEWHDLCLRLGERLEYDSRTFMGMMIGVGIQKNAYELAGDTRMLGAVTARAEEARDEWRALLMQTDNTMGFGDPVLMREYLEQLLTNDELTAMRHLNAEAARRRQARGPAAVSECPGP